MRTVVCAYSEVGHACLDELLAIGADVRLLVTHEDDPGETVWFRSVAELARAAGIPVIAPADVNAPDSMAAIAAVKPELLLSVYYRQMMKPGVLRLASVGALNLHGSLLPRYRGRAPVNWVLVNGERETGVTLHFMDEKPDHGDIVAQRVVPITRDDTALTLTRKLAQAGRLVLRETYPALVRGKATRRRQDHAAASYFGRRRPEDGRIDWSRPAEAIRNLVRAVSDPWPGAFTLFRRRRLTVWSAETRAGATAPGEIHVGGDGTPLVGTGDGRLELTDLTWGAGLRTSGREWTRAADVHAGERFDDTPTA